MHAMRQYRSELMLHHTFRRIDTNTINYCDI